MLLYGNRYNFTVSIFEFYYIKRLNAYGPSKFHLTFLFANIRLRLRKDLNELQMIIPFLQISLISSVSLPLAIAKYA